MDKLISLSCGSIFEASHAAHGEDVLSFATRPVVRSAMLLAAAMLPSVTLPLLHGACLSLSQLYVNSS
jgi:hypothetical protein